MPADQITISADSRAPFHARVFAADRLREWNIEPPFSHVLLAVSELVTNAVKHGGEPITVRLAVIGRCVRLEVSDAGSGTPHLRSPGKDGGFGLHLIAKVCDNWGVTSTDNGKVVWCECTVSDSSHPTALDSRPTPQRQSASGPTVRQTGDTA